MSRWMDDLALVVELACLTENRTQAEQRALLRVAYKVDTERAKATVTNPPEHRVTPFLERFVDQTREPGDHQRVVPVSEQKAKRRVA